MRESDEFLRKLLATFKIEADEHIRALSSGLIELEKAPAPEERAGIVEAIFREAHSLKGAARAVNATEIESICQSLESIFSAMKTREIAVSEGGFDLLHRAVDSLGQLLGFLGTEQTIPAESASELVAALDRELTSGASRKAEQPKGMESQEHLPPEPENILPLPGKVSKPARPTETIRMSAARLDALLLQSEELLSVKLAAGQLVAEVREIRAAVAAWARQWATLAPQIRTLRESLAAQAPENGKAMASSSKLMELMESVPGFSHSLADKLSALVRSAEQDRRTLGRMVDELLEGMKQVRMLPCSSLLAAFPRFVRDASHAQGKEVELVIQGEDIEMDRRILQEMKDPLLHVVRNCLDHGIEKPLERERKNKPRRGTVKVAITPKNSNKVEILIADDGAGIDRARVREAALRLGVVSPEEAGRLDGDAALSLIFQSGVSTSPMVTDISGRGLGLAIVREKVERLGGSIVVETSPGAGTAFHLILPLLVATFRGLLVRAEEQLWILPAANVERLARVSPGGIRTVENQETIWLGDQALSLVRLGDALGLPQKKKSGEPRGNTQVVVLRSAASLLAFAVDEVLAEQEVLVKGLGPPLSRVRNIAGATVLGTGKVAPILNVSDLFRSATLHGVSTREPLAAAAAREKPARKSVLVVEDSITARTLLKNILETAGYLVRTAVDGIEAFTVLKTESFDIVVSDVDMPRMNGFDLTARIRKEKGLSEIPVVLVTSLESREDRERGIDVGASAYIVKSSFDQSNLIGVLQRLA